MRLRDMAAAFAVVVLGMGTTGWAGELKVGDPAPDFAMVGSDGKTYRLADFQGKQAVVLAWFPRAFTPGCTKQCQSFRTEGELLRKQGVAYFTASCDDVETNRRFAESLGLDYPILSDPGCKVAEAYGVKHPERPFAQRWTFTIDRDGRIVEIDRSVQTATHGADVARRLKDLLGGGAR